MRWLRRIVVLAVFVGTLVGGWAFAHRNGDPVHVDYFLGSIDAPHWAVLLGAFALGAFASGLVGAYQSARLALTARRYRRLALGLEEEVHQLRNLPLGPPDDGRAQDRALAVEGVGRSA